MIKCNKCAGKVFVDLTFTDNKDYEAFCLACGKRWFVGISHPAYKKVHEFVEKAMTG